MIEKKSFEKIKLLLQNAKINLVLSNNNLSYYYIFQELCFYNNIINVMNRIKIIEDKVEIDMNLIENMYDDYMQAEDFNEILLNSLTERVDSISYVSNLIQGSEKEETINKTSLDFNKSQNIMGSTSKRNIKNKVGRIPTPDSGTKGWKSLWTSTMNRINSVAKRTDTIRKPTKTSTKKTTSTKTTSPIFSNLLGLIIINNFVSIVCTFLNTANSLQSNGYFKDANGKYRDKDGNILNVSDIPEGIIYDPETQRFYEKYYHDEVGEDPLDGVWKTIHRFENEFYQDIDKNVDPSKLVPKTDNNDSSYNYLNPETGEKYLYVQNTYYKITPKEFTYGYDLKTLGGTADFENATNQFEKGFLTPFVKVASFVHAITSSTSEDVYSNNLYQNMVSKFDSREDYLNSHAAVVKTDNVWGNVLNGFGEICGSAVLNSMTGLAGGASNLVKIGVNAATAGQNAMNDVKDSRDSGKIVSNENAALYTGASFLIGGGASYFNNMMTDSIDSTFNLELKNGYINNSNYTQKRIGKILNTSVTTGTISTARKAVNDAIGAGLKIKEIDFEEEDKALGDTFLETTGTAVVSSFISDGLTGKNVMPSTTKESSKTKEYVPKTEGDKQVNNASDLINSKTNNFYVNIRNSMLTNTTVKVFENIVESLGDYDYVTLDSNNSQKKKKK